jgi:hypothetical protein
MRQRASADRDFVLGEIVSDVLKKRLGLPRDSRNPEVAPRLPP